MAEATTTTPPKMKSKPASSPFEMPKFEMPKFEIPKVEMPAAFREFAERGVAQAKDTYEKMKAVAEEATDVLETTYSTASKGASDYGMKMIEAARVNTNAAFDYAGELLAAKTFSEVIELSSAHARKQFEALDQAEQGTRRAGAEGRDRHRRADQERHEQGVRQGRLTGGVRPTHLRQLCEASPGFGPGFCLPATAIGARPRPAAACFLGSRSGHLAKLAPCLIGFARLRQRATERAAVAQLVRAPDCGSGGRWFESPQLYQPKFQSAPLLTTLSSTGS